MTQNYISHPLFPFDIPSTSKKKTLLTTMLLIPELCRRKDKKKKLEGKLVANIRRKGGKKPLLFSVLSSKNVSLTNCFRLGIRSCTHLFKIARPPHILLRFRSVRAYTQKNHTVQRFWVIEEKKWSRTKAKYDDLWLLGAHRIIVLNKKISKTFLHVIRRNKQSVHNIH